MNETKPIISKTLSRYRDSKDKKTKHVDSKFSDIPYNKFILGVFIMIGVISFGFALFTFGNPDFIYKVGDLETQLYPLGPLSITLLSILWIGILVTQGDWQKYLSNDNNSLEGILIIILVIACFGSLIIFGIVGSIILFYFTFLMRSYLFRRTDRLDSLRILLEKDENLENDENEETN